jgi:hypothetical protein
VGHHNDPETPPNETPDDPISQDYYYSLSSVSSASLATMLPSLDSLSSITASASGLEDTQPTVDESISRPTPPSVTEETPPEGKDKESWWEWLTHKADNVESWVEGFIHDHVPGQNDKQEDKEA